MTLSDRLRPGAECAPWVIDEVKKLEAENEALRTDAELFQWLAARIVGAVPMCRVQIMRQGQYVLIERELRAAINAARSKP